MTAPDTQAPERIFAWGYPDDHIAHGYEGSWHIDCGANGGTEYVLASVASAQTTAAVMQMREALNAAILQLRYLNEAQSRGTTNATIARLASAIAAAPETTALDALIAERVREAVEATWRDVEAALEKEINAEWFTSEVNGKPVTSKGETEFMRLTEAKRVFDVLKANVRAARGSKEGQS